MMHEPLVPVVVAGIAVDDAASARLVKRVIGVAGFLFLWAIVSQVYMLTLVHNIGSFLFGLGFAGCVPACGYFGAKQRSKPLVGLFTCCNCCGMIGMGFYIVLAIIALSIFNTSFDIAGEHQTLKHLINTALPEMQVCCKQLQACDFALSCEGCHIAAFDGEMLPLGSAGCAQDDGSSAGAPVTSADVFFSGEAAVVSSDGSSAADGGNFCVDSNTCQAITNVSSTFTFSNGMFYGLIVVLVLACMPATLGCCWGKSLYDSPMLNGAQGLQYGTAPAYTQAQTAYGGK